MEKKVVKIFRILLMSLLLAGCASVPLPAPTITVPSPTPTITVAPPTPTVTVEPTPAILVEIKSVILEPSVLKNGDRFTLQVIADSHGHNITVDLSQLDTTKKTPYSLGTSGEEIDRDFTISYGNMAANGKKTITVTTTDYVGNIVTATAQVELQNPSPILDGNPPNDNFDAPTLDSGKWIFRADNSYIGFQGGKLLLTTSDQYNSKARIRSIWKITGNFDIQVDFQSGEGWAFPATGHTDAAVLGIDIDGYEYHIMRLLLDKNNTRNDLIYGWNSLKLVDDDSRWTTAVSGTLRLIRTGEVLIYLYDVGNGWQELGNDAVTDGPALVHMGIQSVSHRQVFSTYFDNFRINAGLTTYRP